MIVIKNAAELDSMRAAGALLASVMERLRSMVAAGISTAEVDREAERLIRDGGAQPAFLGYRGFPGSVCASVNDQVVHGIPGPRRLRDGDLFKLDAGLVLDGFVADMAVTIPVGQVSVEATRLIAAGQEALAAAVDRARPGNRLGDIGAAVEAVANREGFGIVRPYGGHGIGRSMHEAPSVLNYGPAGQGPQLKPGMTLAIEPMLNAGGDDVEVLDDDWTVVTSDGSLSVHCEHTVAITQSGPEILTRVPAGARLGSR